MIRAPTCIDVHSAVALFAEGTQSISEKTRVISNSSATAWRKSASSALDSRVVVTRKCSPLDTSGAAKESAKARPAAKANGGPTFSELLPPRSCSHATWRLSRSLSGQGQYQLSRRALTADRHTRHAPDTRAHASRTVNENVYSAHRRPRGCQRLIPAFSCRNVHACSICLSTDST